MKNPRRRLKWSTARGQRSPRPPPRTGPLRLSVFVERPRPGPHTSGDPVPATSRLLRARPNFLCGCVRARNSAIRGDSVSHGGVVCRLAALRVALAVVYSGWTRGTTPTTHTPASSAPRPPPPVAGGSFFSRRGRVNRAGIFGRCDDGGRGDDPPWPGRAGGGGAAGRPPRRRQVGGNFCHLTGSGGLARRRA